MSARNSSPDETLAGVLADRIHTDIVASGLQEGDLFMTLEEVAARYSASRTVTREALSRLRALGVIEGRQRRGVLVARPDPVAMAERWVPLYCRRANREDFAVLAELRYVLEMGAVGLAVSRASSGQRARLAALAADFEAEAADAGHTPAADAVDLAFHALLLEMAGNPLLSGMHRVLGEYFAASAEFDPRPNADAAIRDHHALARAVSKGDADKVRALLEKHLMSTLNREPTEKEPRT